MLPKHHNEARRLLNFIDEAYQQRISLYWTSPVPTDELFSLILGSVESAASRQFVFEDEIAPRMPDVHGAASGGDPPGRSYVSLATADEHEDDAGNEAGSAVTTVAESAAVQELRFACRRAASRLVEMSSDTYLRAEG